MSTYQYDINNQVIYSNEKGFISEKNMMFMVMLPKQTDNKTLITENTYDANNKILETRVNGETTLSKEYDSC